MTHPNLDDKSTWPVEFSAPWVGMRPDGPEVEGRREWSNDRYWVTAVRVPPSQTFNGQPMVRLGIQRIDQRCVRDWRDLQRIKNDVVGKEAEGIEVFPAESRLCDPSNYYLMWVFPKWRVPVGPVERSVVGLNAGLVPQRGFAEERP